MGITYEEATAPAPKKKGLSYEEASGIKPAVTGDKVSAPPAPESGVSDFLKSAGSGLVSGFTGLGDIATRANPNAIAQNLALAASEAIGGNYSGARGTLTDYLKASPITDKADELTGGVTKYEPKTTTGKYAKTVGEFAPGLIGGGEGLIPKALKLATDVIVPGVASEAAGQYAEKQNWDPRVQEAMRIAGGLAGGLTGSLVGSGRKCSFRTGRNGN